MSLTYKGYVGVVTFDPDAALFHGEVAGLRDVITFQAKSADELVGAFRDSVDDYLAFCAEDAVEPEKPYSGKLAFRADPELHRKIAMAAAARGVSINQWMADALDRVADEALHDVTPVTVR